MTFTVQWLSQLLIWMSGCVVRGKKSHLCLTFHPLGVFSAVTYLVGLSDGMSVKTSSGLGSGMGMMYSLYEVMTSCVSSWGRKFPELRVWLCGVGGKDRAAREGALDEEVLIGKGDESRGLVRVTAGWSLFRKFSWTWWYLCKKIRDDCEEISLTFTDLAKYASVLQ